MKRVTQFVLLAAVFVLCVVSFECQCLGQADTSFRRVLSQNTTGVEGGATVKYAIIAGSVEDRDNSVSGELFAADGGFVSDDYPNPGDSRFASIQYAGEGLVLTPIDSLTFTPQTDTSATVFSQARDMEDDGFAHASFFTGSTVQTQGFYEIGFHWSTN